METPKNTNECVEALLDMLLFDEKIRGLDNKTFAELLAAELPMFGEQGAIIDEAIRRIYPEFYKE